MARRTLSGKWKNRIVWQVEEARWHRAISIPREENFEFSPNLMWYRNGVMIFHYQDGNKAVYCSSHL